MSSKGSFHESLGNLLKEARIKKNLTQLDVSQELGYVSTQFVSLFERGYSKVPVKTLGKLSLILGVPKSKIVKLLVENYSKEIKEEINI